MVCCATLLSATVVCCAWPYLCCADEKDVKAAMKKQPNKGGIYFPIAAVQVSCG